MTILRQGDILLIAVDAQTAKRLAAKGTPVPRDNGRTVLAYGEVTGHAHAIRSDKVALMTLPNTEDRFLQIMDASGIVELEHDEHDAHALTAPGYIVRRQREYTSADMKPIRVAD